MPTGSRLSGKDEGTTPSLLFLAALASVGALVVIGWVLSLTGRGLDLTDEGYYLNWVDDPWAFPATVTLFGFVYHPLWEILDGDVARLRQVNLLITCALGALLTWSLVRTLAPAGSPWRSRGMPLAVAVASSPIHVVLLHHWLATPGYNSLTLQALLLTATGVLWTVADSRGHAAAGALVTALGGWLTFCAKPVSAVPLALAATVVILVVRPRRWTHVVASGLGAAGLLVMTALLIDGSVTAFADRLALGADDAAALDGGHTVGNIFRLDPLVWDGETRRIFWWLVLGGAVAGGLVLARRISTLATWAGMLLLAAALGGAMLRTFLAWTPANPLLVAAVPVGFGLAVAAWRFTARGHGDDRGGRGRLRLWSIPALLAVLPAIAAFGTNNNYWTASALFGGFWVLALLAATVVIAGQVPTVRLAVISIVSSLVVVMLVINASAHAPYRQLTPLLDMSSRIEVPRGSSSTLVAEDDIAGLIREFQGAAAAAGMQPGTPVLDLSGESPTLLFALDATPVGAAWVIGGYPGSQELASTQVRRTSCTTLAAMWLIDAPGGARSIDEMVLADAGLDATVDFRVVAEVDYRGGVRRLLAPAPSADVLARCEAVRHP